MAPHERHAARHVPSVDARGHRHGRPVHTSSSGSCIGFPAVAKPKRLVQEVTVLGNTGLIVTPGAIRTDWAGRSIVTGVANCQRDLSLALPEPTRERSAPLRAQFAG
jgi:hypothetical protein